MNVIEAVDANMKLSGMPLTEADRQRIAENDFTRESINQFIEEWTKRHRKE